jgi:hypothetical protein
MIALVQIGSLEAWIALGEVPMTIDDDMSMMAKGAFYAPKKL